MVRSFHVHLNQFLGSYALCIKTPKSEADLVRTRTHVTVWLVDWVLVIASHCFSSVGHFASRVRRFRVVCI